MTDSFHASLFLFIQSYASETWPHGQYLTVTVLGVPYMSYSSVSQL